MREHGAPITLRLDDILVSGGDLRILWSVDSKRFETALHYDDVDLDALRASMEPVTFERVIFHIALFEMSKGVNMRAERLDPGRFRDHFTPDVALVWHRIIEGVFAQWRFQHDDPHAPVPMAPTRSSFKPSHQRTTGDVKLLAFCGGGKDSLVSGSLLNNAGLPWSAFVYTHSVYGDHAHQRKLIGALTDQLNPARVHHLRVDDSFISNPPVGGEIVAAETPSSLMAAMPIVLQHGYEHIVLGHERSANRGNLMWARTGEEVNHQWGKSKEAEHLLNEHMKRTLAAPFSYFSILQPIHDPVIFASLRDRSLESLMATHSCNVSKPWCMRCAKCLYVWLGYAAWLPADEVRRCFGDVNPLTDETLRPMWEALLGLADHLPFECIGQVEQTRLHLHMYAAKGGDVEASLLERSPRPDPAVIAPLLTVHGTDFGAPAFVTKPVISQLRATAAAARSTVNELISPLRV